VQYFVQDVGIPKKTLRIQTSGEHNHSGAADSGALFAPAALEHAKTFIATTANTHHLTEPLKAYLIQQGVAAAALPSDTQLQAWIKRNRKKKRPPQVLPLIM